MTAATTAILALLVIPIGSMGQGSPGLPPCEQISPAQLTLEPLESPPPITPVYGEGTILVRYTYRAPETAWSLEPVRITFTAAAQPSWARVDLSESTHFVELNPAGSTEVTDEVTLDVTVEPMAPAFQPASIQIESEAAEGTCVSSAKTEANSAVAPGFHEEWQSGFEETLVKVPVGNIHQIPLLLENQGNGPIEVMIDFLDQPVKGHASTPPGFHLVGSEANDRETRKILNIPYMAEHMGTETIHVEVSGRSADDNTMGIEPRQLTTVVKNTDAEEGDSIEELPVTILPLVGLGLVTWILATRRRFAIA